MRVETKNRKKARENCGKSAAKAQLSFCSAPKGLRIPAQRCEARVTLGNCREKLPSPTGLWHTQRCRSQPRCGCKNPWTPPPKVAPKAFGATLGSGTKPLCGWLKPDMRPARRSIEVNARSSDQTHSALVRKTGGTSDRPLPIGDSPNGRARRQLHRSDLFVANGSDPG